MLSIEKNLQMRLTKIHKSKSKMSGHISWNICIVVCCVLAYCQGEVRIVMVNPGQNATTVWDVNPRIQRTKLSNMRIYTNDNVSNIVLQCFNQSCFDEMLGNNKYLFFIKTGGNLIEKLGFTVQNVGIKEAGVTITIIASEIEKEIFTQTAKLFVYQPPSKPTLKRDGTRRINETFTITCNTNSRSLPKDYRNMTTFIFSWNIKSSIENHIINGNTLTIKNLEKENHGSTYTCTASEADSVFSVSNSYVIIMSYILNIEVTLWANKKNSETLLSCIAECKPRCKYDWKNKTADIIATGNTILIKNSTELTCQASNERGITDSRTVSESDINTWMLESFKKCPKTATITLAILFILATGVLIGVVLFYFFYIRRREIGAQPTMAEAVQETQISPLYENAGIKNEQGQISPAVDPEQTMYAGLGSSRDPQPEPSQYQDLNTHKVVALQDSLSEDENTYELV